MVAIECLEMFDWAGRYSYANDTAGNMKNLLAASGTTDEAGLRRLETKRLEG